jgi:hopanoid biosynthesis associated RND transporter like protein HpnN
MISLIARIAAASGKHAVVTLCMALLLAGASFVFSLNHLRIDTDTSHLFDPSLPWRQANVAQSRDFPQFDNITLAVVRGATPEEARETANALAEAASEDKLHFHDATAEGGDPFFARNGLLLLPTARLEALLSRIIATQPLLGQLAADPSARGLFGALGLLAEGARRGQIDLGGYDAPLASIRDTLDDAAAGRPTALSWTSLLAGGLADSTVFVVVHPVLDHGSVEQGGAATAALNAIAAKLPDVASGRAVLGITGEVPLADQEFASLTDGLAVGTTIMLLLITLWLFLALRSARLILAVLGTLCLGLVFTLFFAAAAIGTLNLISVAFAILFVGLAVDFAIQFSVRYRDVAFRHREAEGAVQATAREAGGQIALAAAATACGFLAFAPTSFLGVAELGIIAGTGMIIAFVCTVTILPAAIVLFGVRDAAVEVALAGGAAADPGIVRGVGAARPMGRGNGPVRRQSAGHPGSGYAGDADLAGADLEPGRQPVLRHRDGA